MLGHCKLLLKWLFKNVWKKQWNLFEVEHLNGWLIEPGLKLQRMHCEYVGEDGHVAPGNCISLTDCAQLACTQSPSVSGKYWCELDHYMWIQFSLATLNYSKLKFCGLENYFMIGKIHIRRYILVCVCVCKMLLAANTIYITTFFVIACLEPHIILTYKYNLEINAKSLCMSKYWQKYRFGAMTPFKDIRH